MFKTALTFLSPYKFYIYAAVAALVVSGWLFDRHQQYNKGVAQCQLKQAEAQADYWEQRGERLVDESKEALKKEKTVGDTINKRSSTRAEAIKKTIELDTGGCIYSPDELRDLAEAIREANGT